jgi:hypothetical protein
MYFLLYFKCNQYKRISCILLCILPFIDKYQENVYLLPQSSFWNYVHVYTFLYVYIYIYIYVCVCVCVHYKNDVCFNLLEKKKKKNKTKQTKTKTK